MVPLQCVHILKIVEKLKVRFETFKFHEAAVFFFQLFSKQKNAIIHGFYPKNQRIGASIWRRKRTNVRTKPVLRRGVLGFFFKMTPLGVKILRVANFVIDRCSRPQVVVGSKCW